MLEETVTPVFFLTLLKHCSNSVGVGRKVGKHSPKQDMTLCYRLLGESWLDTSQVHAHLDKFCSAALLPWPQEHYQCCPSLPSALGVPPPYPWPRILFQPFGAISPWPSDATAVLVFNSPQPWPAWSWVQSIQASSMGQQPSLSPSQRRWLVVWPLDWTWSLGLSHSLVRIMWGWALVIRLGQHLN